MSRRRERRHTGFTLLEVLLALSLLGIGLLSLAAMQLTALSYGGRGRHLTKAAAVAEVKMEDLMRRRWTNLAVTGGWDGPETVYEVVQSAADENEQAYEVTWRIADLDAGRTRSVDVLVEWDEPKRPDRRYAISNIRFNYEGL
jgi:prepilin-type N-terminal cleavage/methylation domain-containing protein